jgi:hypothetical protein
MAAQHSYLLSPLDQLMPITYNRVILTFTTKVDQTAAIDALRSGLEATCSQLPYLKGRVIAQQDGRLAISWSEQDATPHFREIERPSDIPSYAQLKQELLPSHHLLQSLCPVAGQVIASFPDGNAPVIAASYTHIEGGLFVCLCVHHNVMDGTGTGQLISLWGKHASGIFHEQPIPLLDPDEPRHRLDRLKAAISSGSKDEATLSGDKDLGFESLRKLHPEYTNVLPTPVPPSSPCTSKIFTFTVQKLKTAATECKTSVNNVLCAIIWSCISSVRSIRWQKEASASDDGILHTKSKLGMAVNGRARIGQSFVDVAGRPYIGNVNLYCVTSLELELLTKLGHSPPPGAKWAISDSLASIVQAISTSIAHIDRNFISEVITLTEQASNMQSLLPGWNFFNGPDLAIASWANLDTYAVDFGPELGAPDFVRVPYLQVDGLNIVLPRRRNSVPESIEVVVMLREDDIAELEDNAMWRCWTEASSLHE